jgi:hypothetical protein
MDDENVVEDLNYSNEGYNEVKQLFHTEKYFNQFKFYSIPQYKK